MAVVSFPDPTLGNIEVYSSIGPAHHLVTYMLQYIQTYANSHMIPELAELRISSNAICPQTLARRVVGSGNEIIVAEALQRVVSSHGSTDGGVDNKWLTTIDFFSFNSLHFSIIGLRTIASPGLLN